MEIAAEPFIEGPCNGWSVAQKSGRQGIGLRKARTERDDTAVTIRAKAWNPRKGAHVSTATRARRLANCQVDSWPQTEGQYVAVSMAC
jgi:hypothetical protein